MLLARCREENEPCCSSQLSNINRLFAVCSISGEVEPMGFRFTPRGFEYTSLMLCFLLHNLSSAETLLQLSSSFGNDWFPVTVGYTIARTMFETDVTAPLHHPES